MSKPLFAVDQWFPTFSSLRPIIATHNKPTTHLHTRIRQM